MAFMLNIMASVLQPLVGYFTDKKPMLWLLPLCAFLPLLGAFAFLLPKDSADAAAR